MRVCWRLTTAVASLPASLIVATLPALAADQPPLVVGPTPWQIGFQSAYSPTMRGVIGLNDFVTVIIGLITLFVGGLLVWVMYRYNAKRNPVPSTTTHHTVIEVLWTVIPIVILVAIAIPSFGMIYFQDHTNDPAMTVKVTGHQWYWEYTYPDQKGLDFSSYIVPDDQLKPGQQRLLTADKPLVLPVGENVRVLQTSGDVIHSFFIPSLGMQRYAIPGQIIETWVRIDRPGLYLGECNQICGTNHSRMPINILGVTPAEFKQWVVKAQKEYSADAAPVPKPDTAGTVSVASATQLDVTARP